MVFRALQLMVTATVSVQYIIMLWLPNRSGQVPQPWLLFLQKNSYIWHTTECRKEYKRYKNIENLVSSKVILIIMNGACVYIFKEEINLSSALPKFERFQGIFWKHFLFVFLFVLCYLILWRRSDSLLLGMLMEMWGVQTIKNSKVSLLSKSLYTKMPSLILMSMSRKLTCVPWCSTFMSSSGGRMSL